MVDLVEKYPTLQPFHGSVIIITFATFVMNPPGAYKSSSDHLALLVGFIAITYLSSTFVQTNWQVSMVGQGFSVFIVVYYYCSKL